jgi:hypothetical protein
VDGFCERLLNVAPLDSVTPENCMKWQYLCPKECEFATLWRRLAKTFADDQHDAPMPERNELLRGDSISRHRIRPGTGQRQPQGTAIQCEDVSPNVLHRKVDEL